MKNIVIDTDILVDFLRGFEKTKNYLERIGNEENIVYFSAITEAELIRGKECSKIERRAEILKILSHFAKVSVSNEIALKAGDFARIYNVETADAIVAATAFIMKADLMTRNLSDYGKIKEINAIVPY